MAFKMKGFPKHAGVSPAKQDLGASQTNKNKEEAARAIRDASKQTMEVNEKIAKQYLGETVDAMSKKENTQTGDLDYKGGSFDQAFADADKSGARTFTWNGKKYTTKKKGEKDMVKIPKKKIQPLPTKTDAELKGPKDRPDPTFEGTDEFRSLDEIRADSKKNK